MADTGRMPASDRAAELGAFLMARRRAVKPVGLDRPVRGRRRVTGLRREEVAEGAFISTDYYARIEQGRRPVTGGVLDAIADVLGLTASERTYVFQLAGVSPEGGRDRGAAAGQALSVIQDVVDAMGAAAALVQNCRYDIVASNALGRALFSPVMDGVGRPNMARFAFLDPAAKHFFGDWEWTAAETIASLRLAAADPSQRRELTTLVGELAVGSNDFRTRWAALDVRSSPRRSKVFRHPVAGSIELNVLAMRPYNSELRIYAYVAQPGTPAVATLQRLLNLDHDGACVEAVPVEPAHY
jgi:transcriptional regulator with XRE-family HTH domain